MLLQGKKLLITGVLTPQSIAFGVAELAQQQGAEVILTGFGRAMSLTERSAKRLSPVPEILELDVTNPEHFGKLTEALKAEGGAIDGVLHAIAFAPEDALGGNFLNTPWESVQQAFRVSTFSLKELARAALPADDRGRLRSSRSTSTTRPRRGRSTTGWASARRRSRAPCATSRATSARRRSA